MKPKRPQALDLALCVQLVLVFFCPPIAFGPRSIHLSDLWCMAWLALALTDISIWRQCGRFFLVTGVALAVFYAHGALRPSLVGDFTNRWLTVLPGHESDLFQGGRELVIAARFLSWLWALRVACLWTPAATSERVLLGCTAVSGLLTIVEPHVLPLREALGHFYGFDPNYEYWRGRAYGSFRSPVEAGVALSLGLLLALRARSVPRWLGSSVALVAAGAVLSTRTTTAIASLFIAGAFALPLTRRRVLIATGVSTAALAALAAVAAIGHVDIYRGLHVNDLGDRALVWWVYLKNAVARPDILLLGFGMTPYHTDSSYFFLFTRGGLVALGLFFFWIKRRALPCVRHWSAVSRVAVAFLLIAGLTLDDFVYRQVVTIMIAVGLPLLASEAPRESRQTSDSAT